MNLKELLISAKKGDKDAKERIIEMYYPLIVKESKRVFLNNRTFEDIVQIGIINLLNAINKFDINRDVKSFSSYLLWSIRNGYNYLCRQEIRYNDNFSLNVSTVDGYEACDFLADDINIEDFVIDKIEITALKTALKTLDKEELELIKFLFFSQGRKTLTMYCKERGKDYYYATSLKRRTLRKLRVALEGVVNLF